MENINNNTSLSQDDIQTLQSVRKNARGAAICFILFIIVIPILVGFILGIIAGVKALGIKNQKYNEDVKILGILMIVFSIILLIGAIVVGFILAGKASNILRQNGINA